MQLSAPRLSLSIIVLALGTTSTTVKSSNTVRYLSPRSNGTNLYWIEQNIGNGALRLWRRTLSTGSETSVSFPIAWADPLYLTSLGSDGIYFLEFSNTPSQHWSLHRGTL